MDRLTELANKYNCDKGTIAYEAHGYTEEYQKIIPEKVPFHLLEIGIWHGDSIKMWNEYNSEIRIDAIDNDPSILKMELETSNKIKVFIADQGSTEALSKIPFYISYDIIIDDGSHNYEDILTSFKFLFRKLKKGGYYCIEDLHAPQAQKDRLVNELTSLYNLKNLDFRCEGKLWIIKAL